MSSYRITQSPVPFQSTPSAWRETAFTALVSSYRGISIHSLRMEGDAADRPKRSAVKVFQSTPSAWRETYCLQWWQFRKTHHFNPLPPHGGRRRQHLDIPDAEDTFQSTPSAWRETGAEFSRIPHNAFQSTPSAWRETALYCPCERLFRLFQSTPSAWRETFPLILPSSILSYFNPLPPHGGRRIRPMPSVRRSVFQSTPSAWRETLSFCLVPKEPTISIHSLRMEGDYNLHMVYNQMYHFNPLPPHGGRPYKPVDPNDYTNISIHSLRMEGDLIALLCHISMELFQSTPSAWRETFWNVCVICTICYFNPLPPHGGRPELRL